MRTYLDILWLNFQQFVHYPVEIFASALTKILEIAFLMIFWSLVLNETGNEEELKMLLGYFLVAGGLNSITMGAGYKVGSALRKGIKFGTITNVLMKPYHTLPGIYFEVMGSRSIALIPAIIMMFVGIWILQPTSIVGIGLFGYFLIIASAIGFSINLLEGILTFHVTEPSGLMSSFGHFTRLLSGSFIPLGYFPAAIGSVLMLLPFSMMVYTPITMLSVEAVDREIIIMCLIGLFWATSLNLLAYYFWKKGLRRYEAIGL